MQKCVKTGRNENGSVKNLSSHLSVMTSWSLHSPNLTLTNYLYDTLVPIQFTSFTLLSRRINSTAAFASFPWVASWSRLWSATHMMAIIMHSRDTKCNMRTYPFISYRPSRASSSFSPLSLVIRLSFSLQLLPPLPFKQNFIVMNPINWSTHPAPQHPHSITPPHHPQHRKFDRFTHQLLMRSSPKACPSPN